jgi:peptide/nickel transport system substrate-binding protein
MRFIYSLSIFSLFSWLLVACGGSDTDVQQPLIAKGGKNYGGELKFSSPERITNLFPLGSQDAYSQRITGQVFETLLKLDVQTMEVQPGLAESYEVNEDATVFTFKIRKGVFFHEDPCFGGSKRAMDIKDVKYSLDFACSGLQENKFGQQLLNRVKGASAFRTKTKNKIDEAGVSGIKIIDAQTLQIELEESFVGFDKILTMTNLSVFPKEAFETYGNQIASHPVGTGPFKLDKMDNSGIVLTRNNNYWRKDEFGNQLPFLDKVIMSYVKDKKSELQAFSNQSIDIVFDIPGDQIEYLLGSLKDAQNGKNVKHQVESKSSYSINYVGFNCASPEFSNPQIRKALNYAINRRVIIDDWMNGDGYPANFGFVPSMADFSNEQIKDVINDDEKARQLLKQNGFPGGKGFPVVDFYVNASRGSTTHKMCLGIADELKTVLGITLNIKLCTLQEQEQAITNGSAKIWRSGWVADYPDAESFLNLFYWDEASIKSGYVNNFNFKNATFNATLIQAQKESDLTKRNLLYEKCSQIIVDESPVIPIVNDDFIVMVNKRIRNFKTNEMEHVDFSAIFIKDTK